MSLSENWNNRKYKVVLEKGQSSGSRSFKLTGLANTVTPPAALATAQSSGLPSVGDTLPGDTNCVCLNIDVSQGNGEFIFTLNYDSEVPIVQEADPTERDPVIKGNFVKVKTATEEDYDDNPLISTNFQPFEQIPEFDKSTQQITIQRNYSTTDWDIDSLRAVLDSTNNGSETIDGDSYAAYTLKLEGATYEHKTENGVDYVDCTWTIAVAPSGEVYYPFLVLATGYSEIVGSQLRDIINPLSGTRIAKPALLDAAGAKTNTPFYIPFNIFRPVDWSFITS